ncbi:MAG: thrombospondin type 3 repeat-containing protein [Chloroflexota bacterium]
MTYLRTLIITIALHILLAIPLLAQESTEEPLDATETFVGTIEITQDADGEDGDIIFVSEDGETVFIIAPAGSFSPSVLADYETDALFEITVNIVSEGDADNPATVQVLIFAEYDSAMDTDGDGIVDLDDSCPETANLDVDADDDGIDDACDDFIANDDSDNDGVADDIDTCPDIANPIDETTGEQPFLFDTDADSVLDSCDELIVDDSDDETSEGGFYCRNRDVEHPNGGRIAEAYGVDYAELIADFCGDDGNRRGWGVIRNELRAESNEAPSNVNSNANANGNGNGNSNGNSNGNANGNSNGNSNGNANGNGNGNGNSNGNGNGRGGRP